MAESRKKVIVLGYVALILCIMVVTASYAWMSISSTPTVTDLALSVVTDNKLELAPDRDGTPGPWSSILDLSEVSELEAPLKPATFVAQENSFYAPDYGLDGRVDFSDPTKLTESDGSPVKNQDTEGYLYTYSFWVRSSASYCTVALSEPVVREDGELGNGTFITDEPVWDDVNKKHYTDKGASYAVRMAFHISGNENEEEKWIIYEPTAEEGKITEGIKGSPYEGENLLLRQEPSTWQETTPILKDSVIYNPGEFYDNVHGLFGLEPGESRKVTIYLWLEGQDADCTNAIAGGRVLANLQFAGDMAERPYLHAE